jgi:(2Fe-2S) ferredoxin
MPHFDRHIFTCINEREPGHTKGDCKSKGADAIRDCFKEELKKRGLNKTMRANAAGCLDQCSRGVAVVVYPEQVWYTVRTPDEAREIVEQHLVGGKPVTRLLMDDKK